MGWLHKAWDRLWQGPQRTFCWCPGCNYELVSGGHLDESHRDDGLVAYECARCGCRSEWDFDVPLPVLMSDNS
jgi:transcription elongation factor Elf1